MTVEYSACLNELVVLRCKSNLSYAGIFRGVEAPAGLRPSAIVEIDAASGFAILCPLEFVAEMKRVPVQEGA